MQSIQPNENVNLTAMECKQARQGLNWTRDQLSEASNVGKRTIIDFENQMRQPVASTKLALKRALEGAGVKFLRGQLIIPTITNKGAEND